MTGYTVTRISRPVCPVHECNGSGWIDLGGGASLECECRKIGREMEPQVNEWLAEAIHKFADKAFIEGMTDAEKFKALREGSFEDRHE